MIASIPIGRKAWSMDSGERGAKEMRKLNSFLQREREEIVRRMYRQGDAVSSRDEIFAT